MATAIAIDTLATMRKLEKAGFETRQAEAVAETVAEVVGRQGDDLATKADLATVEKSLRHEMTVLEKSLRHEMVVHRWVIGLNLAVSLAVLGVVVAVALRVFEALPQ